MPSKKKSKGVLERISDVASSAAEVVVDAGSKAIHAVGDLMPSGSSQKRTKASATSSKKKAPKAAGKSSKPAAQSDLKISKLGTNAKTKAKTVKPAIKKSTAKPAAAKPAAAKPAAAKPAARAAKAAPKRSTGRSR